VASRTKELRRAAAVNQWEPLSPEARAALDAGLESAKRGEITDMGSFAKYVDDEPRNLPFDCGHKRPRGVPLVGPYHVCPGCENQNRRNRRHWFLLAVAVVLALVVTCSARAANANGPGAKWGMQIELGTVGNSTVYKVQDEALTCLVLQPRGGGTPVLNCWGAP
jgi:hypothetical protein